MKKKEKKNKQKEVSQDNNINLLETNVDFDENIYFNHYSSVLSKLEFETPINDKQIPYLLSREFLYSYFEVRQDIKPANKETVPQIIGRIKQFSSSLDPKFNIIFLDNIKSYSEILGIEQTKNILIPVLVKICVDKTDIKIHFLKVLHQDFIDYLCSLGDEGISILRQNIIQIIQELYRDKNIVNEALKTLLFKVFIKIAKSIIRKEKDKKDNYMLDLVMSFGYESNVSKDFYLEHKKICIRFISTLAEDFGQDWAENYLLPQMWFFACDEDEEIKKEVLIALPNLCQEIRYELIGIKILKLMKKLTSDKSTNIRQGCISTLAKIIKTYKEKSKKAQEKKEEDNLKLDPGSVNNFIGLIEKLILDKEKDVRDTIIEYIGELINPLDKEELPQKLFDFYKNAVNEFYYNKELISSVNPNTTPDTKNNKEKKNDKKGKKEEKEKEKKDKKEKKENANYYFAFNFPAILFCYGKEVWPKLSPLFSNLCKEKDIKVRRSIIASFHEITKIIGEKITEEELLPLYDNFLNSKSPLEKNFAIKNLPKILSNVNKEIKEKYFKYFDAVSIFQQNMSSKVRNFYFTNWRNKIDVIEGILCYYHLYDKEIIYKSILPQCINFCYDDVYKVRSVSCKILATLILYLYNENYKKNELFELLELFALHKKYYQRICFCKMCKILLENIDLYNEKIKSLLYIIITYDKSRNVRVALSKAFAKIFRKNNFKIINEISFHKLCFLLNDRKNISITNIFKNIDLKDCENINKEELFDLDNINKIIENKDKIFDKENSFIKKEFDFDITECQHKYPRREIINKGEKEIKINKNKNINEIKNDKNEIDKIQEINNNHEDNVKKDEIIKEDKEKLNSEILNENKIEEKNEEKNEEKIEEKNEEKNEEKHEEINEGIKEGIKEEEMNQNIKNEIKLENDNLKEVKNEEKKEEKEDKNNDKENKDKLDEDNINKQNIINIEENKNNNESEINEDKINIEKEQNSINENEKINENNNKGKEKNIDELNKNIEQENTTKHNEEQNEQNKIIENKNEEENNIIQDKDNKNEEKNQDIENLEKNEDNKIINDEKKEYDQKKEDDKISNEKNKDKSETKKKKRKKKK